MTQRGGGVTRLRPNRNATTDDTFRSVKKCDAWLCIPAANAVEFNLRSEVFNISNSRKSNRDLNFSHRNTEWTITVLKSGIMQVVVKPLFLVTEKNGKKWSMCDWHGNCFWKTVVLDLILIILDSTLKFESNYVHRLRIFTAWDLFLGRQSQ